MDQINVDFCFYDDPDYVTDADRDSRILRRWHQQLWSKSLPSGHRISWDLEPGTSCLVHGDVRVSSDTIATTHSNYRRLGAAQMWESLGENERMRYDRSFYMIGGFIIFPTRPQSLNQRRGTAGAIADRFDLTLECIRQHYLGRADNPLADVLSLDATYFRLFGDGAQGFANFVDFFHLQDLASPDSVRWLDGSADREWRFDRPPLPQAIDGYRHYLDSVADFVAARKHTGLVRPSGGGQGHQVATRRGRAAPQTFRGRWRLAAGMTLPLRGGKKRPFGAASGGRQTLREERGQPPSLRALGALNGRR